MTINISGRRASSGYEPPRVSWDAFHDWVDAEHRAEWVDGEIIELVTESIRHQLLTGFLYKLLEHSATRDNQGIVLFATFLMRLRHRPSGRVPDVLFVATEHLDRLKDTYLDGPADLAVEIVSPSSEVRDRREKLAEYEAAGIPEYWIIDEPHREAHFYVLNADGRYQPVPVSDGGIYTSAVLPGLRLRVDWLWQTPLPTLGAALANLPDLVD